MSVREDREEFETTGLQGLIRRLMAKDYEGFVKVEGERWRGSVVDNRPTAGSGPLYQDAHWVHAVALQQLDA